MWRYGVRMVLGRATQMMKDHEMDSNSKQHKSDVIATHRVRGIEID